MTNTITSMKVTDLDCIRLGDVIKRAEPLDNEAFKN